jgi:hypothetical protein
MGGFAVRQPGLVPLSGLIALACGFAQAQTPDDKRPKIDVDSYTIDAQINPETQTITARTSVRFTPLEDQTTAAIFELNNNLNISRTVDDRGQPVGVTRNQQDNTVRLAFPAALPKGQPEIVTFTYDGRLTGSEESPIYGIKFAAIQNDYAYLLYPARWFPISGYTSDRFTSKMNIRQYFYLRVQQAFIPGEYRGGEGSIR